MMQVTNRSGRGGVVRGPAGRGGGRRSRPTRRPPVNVPGIDKPVIVVTGEINGTETWTNNYYYVLRGAVFVDEGATLNIQAGTRVIGEAGSVGTLIVAARRPAERHRHARGSPIVFTSDQPVGTRSRGDWGGLIINGRAPVNLEGGEGQGEANTGVYGGDDPNDNSGIAALRARGVRRHRVQPRQRAERHRLPGRRPRRQLRVHPGPHEPRRRARVVRRHGRHQARSCSPTPATTASTGRSAGRGRVQFVAVHQRGDDADNGIEADNNEFNNDLLPRANPQIYNMTICGDPDRNEGAESVRGILFRRGTAVTFRNFLITGFKTHGHADRRRHDARAGEQRHDPDRRRRHLGHGRSGALERRAVHHQRAVSRMSA